MNRNLRKILMTVSLILMAALSLSACSIPGANVTPTTAPTMTAAPIPSPTTAPIPSPTTAPILSPTTAPIPSPTAVPSPTPQIVTGVSLRAFQMVDAQHGWAASEQMALRTADGGKTWQNVTPKAVPAGIEPVFQVAVISPQAAWMLVPDAGDYKKGTLYRTTDSGQTWQGSAVPFSGGWIQFQDDKKFAVVLADRGVAAGSQAVDLYQTSDGGATWNLISRADPENPSDQGIPFGGDKSGVTFRDSAHGWVTGFIPMDGTAYLYYTQDSGKTWKQVQLDLPAGWQQAQIDTRPPVFFGGQEGLLALRSSGNVGQLVLFITHNGGETWQATTPLAANGMVSIPSAEDVFVWGGAKLYSSQDAGRTWQERTPNVDLSQGLIAMQFVDRNTGWALSQDAGGARLYSTTDGGLTWK